MPRFANEMVAEAIQPFWAALQRGEFISDAAAQAGTYRKQGTRWVAARGAPAPRPQSEGTLPVVRRARRDRAGSRPGRDDPRDRSAPGQVAVDGLARAAAQRRP